MDTNRVVDLSVGFLVILGVLCLAYVSVSFGNVNLLGTGQYEVEAVFSTVAGLSENTEVEMRGIRVGSVRNIRLEDFKPHVTLSIDEDVTLPQGTIASVRTEGLLGEKYISLSPGGMPGNIAKDGSGKITETNDPILLEDLIGNMVFGNSGGGDS